MKLRMINEWTSTQSYVKILATDEVFSAIQRVWPDSHDAFLKFPDTLNHILASTPFSFKAGDGEHGIPIVNAHYNDNWGNDVPIDDLEHVDWRGREKPFVFVINTGGGYSPVKFWDNFKRVLAHEATHFLNYGKMSTSHKERTAAERYGSTARRDQNYPLKHDEPTANASEIIHAIINKDWRDPLLIKKVKLIFGLPIDNEDRKSILRKIISGLQDAGMKNKEIYHRLSMMRETT